MPEGTHLIMFVWTVLAATLSVAGAAAPIWTSHTTPQRLGFSKKKPKTRLKKGSTRPWEDFCHGPVFMSDARIAGHTMQIEFVHVDGI